jgi:hypothetical protein
MPGSARSSGGSDDKKADYLGMKINQENLHNVKREAKQEPIKEELKVKTETKQEPVKEEILLPQEVKSEPIEQVITVQTNSGVDSNIKNEFLKSKFRRVRIKQETLAQNQIKVEMKQELSWDDLALLKAPLELKKEFPKPSHDEYLTEEVQSSFSVNTQDFLSSRPNQEMILIKRHRSDENLSVFEETKTKKLFNAEMNADEQLNDHKPALAVVSGFKAETLEDRPQWKQQRL